MPILLMLVFAIISFGFLFAQNLALDNAARQTARYGVVENRTCADVIAQAKDAASPLVTLSTSSVVVTRGTTTGLRQRWHPGHRPRPARARLTSDNILYVTLNYKAASC